MDGGREKQRHDVMTSYVRWLRTNRSEKIGGEILRGVCITDVRESVVRKKRLRASREIQSKGTYKIGKGSRKDIDPVYYSTHIC